MTNTLAVVTHGGAGNSTKNRDGCVAAARAALRRLSGNALPLLAAVDAVVLLEDDPRFNAGIGSIRRADGKTVECDAAVMDSGGRLGAVSCLQGVKNPVRVALEVATSSAHWMLAGAGAREFALSRGFEEYDFGDAAPSTSPAGDTVGAVTRDASGRFAVAASTGGSAPALRGRVGDTPIPGCGFWVGEHAAVTATGIGEEIVRSMLARRVYDWISAGMPLQQALERGIALFPAKVDVGLIALTRDAAAAASNRDMPYCILEDGA